MCVSVCECEYVCSHVCMCESICTSLCKCVYKYVCEYMRVCEFMSMHVCLYVRAYVCVCVCLKPTMWDVIVYSEKRKPRMQIYLRRDTGK